MRVFVVAVAGLMVAGVGQAQQASSPGAAQLNKKVEAIQASISAADAPRSVVVSPGCPGQLQARQQANGVGVVWTTDRDFAIHGTMHGLGIHVEFATPKTAVKSLELRVSYLPLGPRSMLVDPALVSSAAKSPEERTKTFDLEREAAMRIGGDLLVGPAATITRVHLMSATFADGSVWHASSDDACSIVPSKYMLVEAKR